MKNMRARFFDGWVGTGSYKKKHFNPKTQMHNNYPVEENHKNTNFKNGALRALKSHLPPF